MINIFDKRNTFIVYFVLVTYNSIVASKNRNFSEIMVRMYFILINLIDKDSVKLFQ